MVAKANVELAVSPVEPKFVTSTRTASTHSVSTPEHYFKLPTRRRQPGTKAGFIRRSEGVWFEGWPPSIRGRLGGDSGGAANAAD